MKKIHVTLIVIVLVSIGGLLSLLFLLHGPEEFNTPKVKTFCLTEYQWEIQTFSTDRNVGEVNDKNIAIKNAKSLWLEKYSVDIPKTKIEVAYDSKEECWHVYSTQSPNVLGGVLHTIIQKNGEVLAVWSDD